VAKHNKTVSFYNVSRPIKLSLVVFGAAPELSIISQILLFVIAFLCKANDSNPPFLNSLTTIRICYAIHRIYDITSLSQSVCPTQRSMTKAVYEKRTVSFIKYTGLHASIDSYKLLERPGLVAP